MRIQIDAPVFYQGDKVKLDYVKIISNPDYPRLVSKYKKFVEDHKDKVFTVEYDPRHTIRPSIVCLAEDPTDPKWLWYTGYLQKVENED